MSNYSWLCVLAWNYDELSKFHMLRKAAHNKQKQKLLTSLIFGGDLFKFAVLLQENVLVGWLITQECLNDDWRFFNVGFYFFVAHLR